MFFYSHVDDPLRTFGSNPILHDFLTKENTEENKE